VHAAAPYAALLIFPFVVNLLPNPINFFWFMKAGDTPMPPVIAARASRIDPYWILVIEGVTLASVLLLIRWASVSAEEMGLYRVEFRDLLIGSVAGSAIGLVATMLLKFLSKHGMDRERGDASDSRVGGSFILWVVVISVVAFSEELWRVTCFVLLFRAGFTVVTAITLATIAFALAHVSNGVARALGTGLGSIVEGLLYVSLRSLPAMAAAHFALDIVGLWWVRCHTPGRK
jgi:membrane protease YdiL (CAAX protease family)